MKKLFSVLVASIAMCTLFADQIVDECISGLKNLDKANNFRSVVVVVATRGMDRTKLVSDLEEALGCINVSHKNIGEVMQKYGKNPNAPHMMVAKAIHDYSQKVMEGINKVSKNTLFAIDGSMEPVLPYLKMMPRSKEVNWIIVRMEQPRDEVIANLMKKGETQESAEAMLSSDLASHAKIKNAKYTFDAAEANWGASIEKLVASIRAELNKPSTS